jgi:dTDP-glucose 4,6-dehydratase
MTKIVYITGCLGFIGSYFTKKCLKLGWMVFGVDKMTYAANGGLLKQFQKYDNFKFLKEDIKNLDYLYDCDYIVNFAAESHVENSIRGSDHFISSNVLGVQNLLELIRTKHINCSNQPMFIQISTDEVYGDIKSGAHIESDRLMPSNPYSASKASADMLIFAWARTYSIKYNVVRPTNNYGIFQYPEKLIPLSVKNLNRNLNIKLHDEGEPIRNWLHADDTANAILNIIESNCVNEIFNVAGGFEQKNKDTVQKVIESYFGQGVDWMDYVDPGYTRAGQDVRYALDDSKLRSLGWEPKRIFDKEIYDIVDYYKNNFIW